ncbi:MAG TPA: type II toxin-antitoxin system HicA family toxin [Blastocatellia bacterium]|nr:type II toxin-antitoxin system HicA family toxin [Blastocatellia bacterium]
MRNLTAREVISALIHDGFYLRRSGGSAGSHHRYQHADGRRVTVSFHGAGDTFRIKTLKSMLEDQAQWSEADLHRLKLLK